ncbi:MAG: hypothetical protein C0476_07895 [Sphingomonas sp.]|nr:hypothetical protein [Sphingomonas sp.]
MERPASIIRFEQFYAGHIGIGLAGSLVALFGPGSAARAQATEAVGPWLIPAVLGLAVVTQIALWYLIAHRASAVAKWVLVAFTAANVIVLAFLMFGIATGIGAEARSAAGSAASVIASALLLAAVAHLFRPDAKAWFGEGQEVT